MLGADIGIGYGREGRGGPGGWFILDEPELHIVGQVMVPDLAGWRRERMPELPTTAAFELVPDWACEVLSPSNAARDRTRKMHHYARAGVRHVWLVDPAIRLLEVFRLEGERWLLALSAEGDATVRAEPFDAIELALAPLWAG
jgi:Uma2 family endonuclease